jgi:uncharacterized protein (TIGR01777 family)
MEGLVMRVFITGGTGLIGSRITQQLLDRGDAPVVLTRRRSEAAQQLGPKVEIVEGDPMMPGAWSDTIDSCDGVIHLAGESVFGKRWNAAFKQLLIDSRVKSTQYIVQAILRRPLGPTGTPKVLVNASAIGFYGPRGDEELGEDAAPGNDSLAALCVAWEKAAQTVGSSVVRLAIVRVGVVLTKAGGALAKLLSPFKMFAGGPIGSGRQWMSWIHHQDMTDLFLFALDNPNAKGVLNGTAPNPVTNRDFSTALGKALGRPSFVWTPGFALRLLIGEAADIVTTGQRVLPRQALAQGFAFRYPTIDAALAQIFTRAD